jgi:glycosyltransferase involved in cell wall biosynthesis
LKRFFKSKNSIAYVTLNGKIPSTKADGVAVMTMCEQFAKLGLDTLLLIPACQGVPLSQLGGAKDVFEFYSVESCFELVRFPNFFGILSRFSKLYSLALVLYLKIRGISLINSRSIEVAVWATRLRVPVILESHNFSRFEFHSMISDWVSATQQSTSKTSMVVTTHAAKLSYMKIGIPEDRIMVLPNGANIDRFNTTASRIHLLKKYNFTFDSPLIVFSGSLQSGRGGEEMIACAELLPEAQFLIIGGTQDQVTHYQKLAESRGIKNVSFAGHIVQSELPNYLMTADILLMPYTTSFSEHSFKYTSPMKMFEYLATGKPMVATDFPILHEILEHGRNVIFVAPDSGEELARGIRYLLDNPELAQRIGRNALEDARKYSWNSRASKLITWQQVIGSYQ